MSNKSRNERAATDDFGGRQKVTPAQKLETLELYIRHQSSQRVGELLGISAAAVRDRLFAMKVRLRSRSDRSTDVVSLNGEEFLNDLKRKLRAAMAEASASTSRRYQPWTPEEDAAVMRSDRPAAELAAVSRPMTLKV